MKFNNFMSFSDSKVIGINILILSSFLIGFELVLGKWLKTSPAYEIPETIVNRKIKMKTFIDGKDKPYVVEYTRDKNGYRLSPNMFLDQRISKKQILTIGGSTTDQRLISDGSTFQDVIQSRLGDEYQVINAGVDGQSSFGHLFSIKNWHSKVLDSENIHTVIFLVGMNDVRFATGLSNAEGNMYDSPTVFRRLRGTFSKRSFFYLVIRRLKDILFDSYSMVDGVTVISHGLNNPKFIDDIKLANPSKITYVKQLLTYGNLIKRLSAITSNKFPLSRIYFIQFQTPKCFFYNANTFSVRVESDSSSKSKFTNNYFNYCKQLGQIYLAQDKAISELPSINRPIVLKMYLDAPIPDYGFYDGLHTNNVGSKILANYILEKVNFTH